VLYYDGCENCTKQRRKILCSPAGSHFPSENKGGKSSAPAKAVAFCSAKQGGFMKITTKQITTTAVLLAICIVSQFFKNTSVYITGPIINACLIIAALGAGMACGIILSVITPVTSFLITGSPIMSAIPAIIPCVMIGNIILVVAVSLIAKKIKGNAGLIAGMAAGSIVKALFMGVVIALVLIPSLLPEAMVPKMAVFQTTFSVTQLITAVIGSVLAFIIWIPLKKVIAEQN
jgi:uncharacterized membrane protein YeaQ/YmgE (transglycosylase-associated protein family)